MLSRVATPPSSGPASARRVPHCRTCGKPMKGHNAAICQLRSPSSDRDDSSSDSGSISSISTGTLDEYFVAAGGLLHSPYATPPPMSRDPSSQPSDHSHEAAPRVQTRARSAGAVLPSPIARVISEFLPKDVVPRYPHSPIRNTPSFDLPPIGQSGYRKNPYLSEAGPSRRRNAALSEEDIDEADGGDTEPASSIFSSSRASSLAPTEPADDPEELAAAATVRQLLTPEPQQRQAQPNRRMPGDFRADSPSSSAPRNPFVLDTDGVQILGIRLNDLPEEIRRVLVQAGRQGHHAVVVRPRVPSNINGSLINSEEEANRRTTCFVADTRGNISLNTALQTAKNVAGMANPSPYIHVEAKLNQYQFFVICVIILLATILGVSLGGVLNSTGNHLKL